LGQIKKAQFQERPKKMKLSNRSNLLLFGSLLTIAAVGCKTNRLGTTPLPGAGTSNLADAGPGKSLIDDGNKATTSDKAGSEDVASVALSDPNKRKDWPRDHEIFKSDTVHFDFDSSVITEAEKPKVAAVADYIKSHPLDALEIEGHCDVRGTEEYNRALGEHRALALREELIRLGIDPARVDTVSFGEDRPIDPGHDESAYKKNRRGEFVLEKHQNLVGLNSP
jgi:peptidoglycan-associated lipoprotein